MPYYPKASGGSPGGSNTQVQFNNSGSFGGVSGLTTDASGNLSANTVLVSNAGANGKLFSMGTSGGLGTNTGGNGTPVIYAGNSPIISFDQGNGVTTRSDTGIGWASSTTPDNTAPDTSLSRAAAAVVQFNNLGQLTARTFAQLPGSPVAGMFAYVSDSTVNTWGTTITGTGANKVLAFYDGTNWTVAGK